MQDAVRIGSGTLEIEFKEPGVHPFATVYFNDGGMRIPAAILGAKQIRYYHKGASFPRIISGGNEEEGGAKLELTALEDDRLEWSDMRSGFEVRSTVEVSREFPAVRVEHRLTAGVDVGLNRAFDRFDFVYARGTDGTGELEYCFSPHLCPGPDFVIADHVFRSPAIVLEKSGGFFALVPDLEAIEGVYRLGQGEYRYYMNLNVTEGENQSPAVVFGLGRSRVKGHVYFKSDFSNELTVPAGTTLVLAYYVLASRGSFGRRDLHSFIWGRFARRHLDSGLPQVVGFDRYAAAGLARIFKRSDLFKRFELEGQPCGGTIGIHLVNRRGVRLMSYRQLGRHLRAQDLSLAAIRRGVDFLTGRPRWTAAYDRVLYRFAPRVPPQVFFQAWYNNLRSAYGAYHFARKWRDRELLQASLEVKNLALLAPAEGGVFPAVCYPTEEGVYWSRGTRGFKQLEEYNTSDCATTAYYMALWFRDHESDPRLLRRCREFAGFLSKVQLPSGAFPSWVKPSYDGPVASPELKESATTACPTMFLALLYLLDGDDRHLEMARKGAEFVSSEVLPQQKWFDFETFYSCSYKRIGLFDRFTGNFAQNTMSMYWAAEAFRLLYLATGEPEYRELGLNVLSHLLLYQQVWDPPFLSIDAFGGFGVMNTDGEWNDARQALMATLLMDYYRMTGDAELMERGIAALRASFTTMYLEENRKVAPGNMVRATHEETGSVGENYGHFGFDYGVPGFIDSDWGAGSSCQAAAYVQKHYGDIFVDWAAGRAFGINGCRVTGYQPLSEILRLQVDNTVEGDQELAVVLTGDAPKGLRVEVNGRQAERAREGFYLALI